MSRKTPVVAIYASNLRHMLEGFAYQLAWSKCARVLIVTDLTDTVGEHPWCLKRIRQFPGLEVIDRTEPARPTDRLFFSMHWANRVWDRSLNRWLAESRSWSAITNMNYARGWRDAIKEFVRGLPYTLLTRSFGFEAARSSRHPYFFVPHKFFLTPPPHPQFVVDPVLRGLMYGPLAVCPRPFRFHFVGSRQPQERGPVLKAVRAALLSRGYQFTTDPDEKGEVLWVEYGEGESSRGVAPPVFVKTLDRSVFCVCPLGWGGNWTHRVIEAVLRGVVPIVPDEKRYNIGLQDGVNCIAVRGGRWDRAINRAAVLKVAQTVALQRAIAELRVTLLLDTAAQQTAQRAGFLTVDEGIA